MSPLLSSVKYSRWFLRTLRCFSLCLWFKEVHTGLGLNWCAVLVISNGFKCFSSDQESQKYLLIKQRKTRTNNNNKANQSSLQSVCAEDSWRPSSNVLIHPWSLALKHLWPVQPRHISAIHPEQWTFTKHHPIWREANCTISSEATNPDLH